MSIPSGILRYAGIWNATSTYRYGMFVQSSLINNSFAAVIGTITGGPDPSVQPSAVWIPFPAPASGDITSVIPGLGITGGGSSGNVTITNNGIRSIVPTGLTIGGTNDITLTNDGVIQIVAGDGITIDGTKTQYTINATAFGQTVNSVSSGNVGISIGGTGQDPTVLNEGVLELTPGTNITITGTKSNYTINSTGGGGGVQSVGSGNAGINITGTPTDPLVSNEGVLELTQGANISISGTKSNYTIAAVVTPSGVQSVAAGNVGISIGGTAADPTVLNDGVIELTSGSGIVLSGTKANYTITATGAEVSAGLQNVLQIVPTATGRTIVPVSWTAIQPAPNSWVPDATTASPIAGGNNSGWRNFKEVGTSGAATKVAWYPYNPNFGLPLPYVLNPTPAFRKCDLKSVWAVIYTKNRITTQGNLFFNIFTYDITAPPVPPASFTARFDYSIGTFVGNIGGTTAAPTGSQTLAAGYRYLICCVDTVKTPPQTTATVGATLLIIGTEYTILTVGTSNFTLVGAAVNTVGCVFIATGPTLGTGTVTRDVISTAASGSILLSGAQIANQTGFLRDPYDLETGIHHIPFNGCQIVTGGAPQPANVSLLTVSAIAISTNSGTVTPTLDFTVEKVGWSATRGVDVANYEYDLTF